MLETVSDIQTVKNFSQKSSFSLFATNSTDFLVPFFSYCECFAAGAYCSEPCSCIGCFNKPEYEETVLGARQQIESRNPLAFAPKILGTNKVGTPFLKFKLEMFRFALL